MVLHIKVEEDEEKCREMEEMFLYALQAELGIFYNLEDVEKIALTGEK